MKVGLALAPELAQASRYAVICIASATAVQTTTRRDGGGGRESFLRVAFAAEEETSALSEKTYVPKPEPLLSVFKTRTLLMVAGRNLVSRLLPWMNELQENLNEAAESEDDGEDLELDVPPFKPVLRRAAQGSLRDYAVLFLKRIYEILASTSADPKLACKLLKDYHASAKRKRFKYFFQGSVADKVRTGGLRVKKMTYTTARSACLGYLSEMTINQVLIVYKTALFARNGDFYAERVCDEEDRNYDDFLDYFQHHTFLNMTRVGVRLVFASIGVGLGSLIYVSFEPKVLPAVTKVGTVAGFALGDFCGGVLVDRFLIH